MSEHGRESAGGEALRLFAAALIGGAIGAAIGLLLAPKPGSELRADLKQKTGTATEKARGVMQTAKEKMQAARDKMQERCGGDEAADEQPAPEPEPVTEA